MQGTTSTRYRTKRTPSGWSIVDTSEQVHGVPSMNPQIEKHKTRDEAERACEDLNDRHRRRVAGEEVEELLNGLPAGSEFKLSSREAGRAYQATYRKNDRGLWDQVAGTCEAPNVVNMSPDHLGFVLGDAAIIRAAIARWVVVDTKVAAGEHTPILGRFTSEHEAAEFISTLPEHESGRYGLDGPGEVS